VTIVTIRSAAAEETAGHGRAAEEVFVVPSTASGALVAVKPRSVDLTEWRTYEALQSGGLPDISRGVGGTDKTVNWISVFFDKNTMDYPQTQDWNPLGGDSFEPLFRADLREKAAFCVQGIGDWLGTRREMPLCDVQLFNMKMMLAFSRKVAAGVVSHGPLLGWAYQQGDRFYIHNQTSVSSTREIAFIMPQRTDTTFNTYPFYQHADDGITAITTILQQAGYWPAPAIDVRGLACFLPPACKRDRNAAIINNAIPTVSWSSLRLPPGVEVMLRDPLILDHGTVTERRGTPCGMQAFFFSDQAAPITHMVQGRGDWFWAFRRKESGMSMEVAVVWILLQLALVLVSVVVVVVVVVCVCRRSRRESSWLSCLLLLVVVVVPRQASARQHVTNLATHTIRECCRLCYLDRQLGRSPVRIAPVSRSLFR
jgi:hypothetical protein